MTPSLTWLDDVIRYFLAADAPDVIASTATSAATTVMTNFKFVPSVAPGLHGDEREQHRPGIFRLL